MPFAEMNGIRIFYEEQGEGEPLLCVSGLGADHLSWLLQREAFAARHRLVLFDNRDVGQSTLAGGPYGLADLASDVLGLIDHLGLDTLHLLGISLGGAVAQHVALTAPERIRTLTLASTWAGAGRWARERARVWALEASRLSREEFLDSMLLLNLSEAFYENADALAYARQTLLANPRPQSPEAFARQAFAVVEHDLRGRLGALTTPVHVVAGAHDILVPHWKQEELAAQIAGARLTVIADAPHALHLERPQEFNDAVLGFLAEHAEGRTRVRAGQDG
jgi:pimeloyl-ACP methyl ester carboxylesterase